MITARTSRETRHESNVFTTTKAIRIPTTTATNDQPQRAKPATTKAIFKTNPMLIGRLELFRVSLFFSVRFIIFDLFFNCNAARSRLGVFEFRGQENPVNEVHTRLARTNTLARIGLKSRERGRFFGQPTGKGD